MCLYKRIMQVCLIISFPSRIVLDEFSFGQFWTNFRSDSFGWIFIWTALDELSWKKFGLDEFFWTNCHKTIYNIFMSRLHAFNLWFNSPWMWYSALHTSERLLSTLMHFSFLKMKIFAKYFFLFKWLILKLLTLFHLVFRFIREKY